MDPSHPSHRDSLWSRILCPSPFFEGSLLPSLVSLPFLFFYLLLRPSTSVVFPYKVLSHSPVVTIYDDFLIQVIRDPSPVKSSHAVTFLALYHSTFYVFTLFLPSITSVCKVLQTDISHILRSHYRRSP